MDTIDLQPAQKPHHPALRLLVTAMFTREPVKDALDLWIEELDLAASIVFAPYNQIFQQLLDPGSLLSQNRKGVNIVLVRIEDWQRFYSGSPNREQIEEHLARNAADLIGAVQTALARLSTPLILALCPNSWAALPDQDSQNLFARIEEQVASALGEI